MRWQYKKKRFITLIEIMIVIFLIGIIGGVVGYNMKGSLDKGRKFKTEQAMAQIKDILELAIAENETVTSDTAPEVIRNSPLVKDPEKMLVDGWNKKLKITVADDSVTVTSDGLDTYNKKQAKT